MNCVKPSAVRKLAIFGATGSIGTSALHVLGSDRKKSEQIQLVALSARSNVKKLTELAIRWQPLWLLIASDGMFDKRLHRANNNQANTSSERQANTVYNQGFVAEVVYGEQSLISFARSGDYDILLLAISGSAALPIAWEVIARGKTLLLANKESLVAGGELLMQKAKQSGAQIIPIDSEHSGLWQCLGKPFLPQKTKRHMKSVTITASGGPFWQQSLQEVANVSPEQACAHPNWSMGAKISVDSATMVNKALEIIEAYWLFDLDYRCIDVCIHPQSFVHALVHFYNGSSLVQLSLPDMQVALSLALFGDDYTPSGIENLQFQQMTQLKFYPLDGDRFRAIPLARQALASGGDRCLCFNTANEVANAAFRARRIRFVDILTCIETVLQTTKQQSLVHYLDICERQDELALVAQDVIQHMQRKL